MIWRVGIVALLALVYLLALASFHPWDAVAGVVVGAGALALSLRLPRAHVHGRPHPIRPLRFAAGVLSMTWDTLREVTVGTWDVALVVLHIRPLPKPGIVAVPIGERSSAAVATQALLSTLTPGDFFVDVDWEQGVMLVHVLDASDPDAVRRRYADFYDRRQREVVP